MKLLVPLGLSTVLFVFMISAPTVFAELLIKLLVPLKVSIVLYVEIAPPSPPAELLIKLLIPWKLTVLYNMQIAPPTEQDALLSRKVVFPVNVRLLLCAMIPPPPTKLPPQSM